MYEEVLDGGDEVGMTHRIRSFQLFHWEKGRRRGIFKTADVRPRGLCSRRARKEPRVRGDGGLDEEKMG